MGNESLTEGLINEFHEISGLVEMILRNKKLNLEASNEAIRKAMLIAGDTFFKAIEQIELYERLLAGSYETKMGEIIEETNTTATVSLVKPD